ncbi:lysine--tRNA ligase [Clostridium perfringens]|uniref:lysine--tRNA ligase n=1 Tax=Clostridium perfringens TaxID=1502 RepID=UPI00263B1748|nr:lysine--tRNA ligase [Clostridium perfringens]MDK0840649.1 lysine--tRNA ligase [Clostridium perfringens]MDN4738458.1 lysine--tRNA ligase [Clostridium perfringens]MDN4740295.1 lysine--tRNA ligase [Clostridium perfringens]
MSNEEINIHEAEEQLSEQEMLRRQKLVELQEAGKDPFDVYKVERTHSSADVKDNFEELEGKEVKVAGRLMSKRGQGKVVFADLADLPGKIQLFIKIDNVGEEALKEFKTFDLGDWVAATGEVFKTKMGEVSVKVTSFELICKSLKPLPEKWHGLKDPDLRYRQREVDIITNPEVKDTFIKRSQIVKAIREFLDNRGFLEVDTPILSPIAGGAAARPFITHHNALDIDMYLRIATELYLKRLIVAGFEKVYEMGKNFRNEGVSVRHNPEFTAIELYEAYADYNDMMEIMENMIAYVCEKVNGSTKVTYEGTEIDFTPPWRRITMVDAVKEFAGIDFNEIKSDEEAQAIAKEKNLEFPKPLDKVTKGEVLNMLFEEYGEDKLIQPTFLVDYPVEISPLTKKKRGNEMFTERFEGFVYGREVCNAYSELNDPIVQRERFEQQAREREYGDDEAYMLDEEFMSALETGMPPTGGLGIGIDRMIMFLTDSSSIRDVILFPTMKPIGLEKAENRDSSKETYETYDKLTTEKIDFSKVKVEPLFEDMVGFDTFSKSDFRVVKVKNCKEVPKSKKLLKFTLDDGSEKERVILSGIKEYYSAESLIGKTLLAICNLPPRKMMGIDSEGMIISAICEYDGEEKLNLIMLDDNIPAGSKLY